MDAVTTARNLAKRLSWLGYSSDARRLMLCSSARSAPTVRNPEGVPFRCEHRLCPRCMPYVQRRATGRLASIIRPTLIAGGGSIHLTITAPWDRADFLWPATKLLSVFRRFVRSWAWCRRGKGFSKRVGMVFSLEFTSKEGIPAAPHLHIFLFSWDPEIVWDCAQSLQNFWTRHHGETAQWGMMVTLPGKDWQRVLSYVLKSSQVLPGWPDEAITAAMKVLQSGMRLRGGYGLAKVEGGLFGKSRPSSRRGAFLDK